MEINIRRDINDEIICNEIKRSLILRRQGRGIIILFVAGLIIPFIDNNEINLAIGMVFIGASLMQYYQTRLLARIPTANKKIIDEYREGGRAIKIDINDSFIDHETMKSYIRMDWSAIVSYQLYKGYLIISPSGNYRSSFVIGKSELSENEYVELYDFLKENFYEKR